jgi:hypothetical protein
MSRCAKAKARVCVVWEGCVRTNTSYNNTSGDDVILGFHAPRLAYTQLHHTLPTQVLDTEIIGLCFCAVKHTHTSKSAEAE